VVVFTAFASDELEAAAHAAGAAAYVVKDTTAVEQLREVLHGAVVTAARGDARP
jgi:CheY-like chemotaxis protein